jgi:cytochrome c peroxidase
LPNYANPAFPVHYDANVRAQDNAPSLNPVTNAGAALGRVLFYDKNLSRNNTISCASCHVQEKAFSDESTFSRGFEGGLPVHTPCVWPMPISILPSACSGTNAPKTSKIR